MKFHAILNVKDTCIIFTFLKYYFHFSDFEFEFLYYFSGTEEARV